MPVLPVRRAARAGLAAFGLAAVTLAPTALVLDVPAALAAEAGDTVTLLDINDFHGHLSQGQALACTLTQSRTANTAVISSGDNIGASEFASSIQQDEPTIDYLNALGLQASAIGNHEYDRGYEDVTGRVADRADFSYLAANVYTSDGELAHPAYEVVDAGDVKVAVVGAVTDDTPSLVSPSGIEGLTFGDPVEGVNAAIEDLQASGEQYDVLVVAYHEGADVDASEPGAAPETDSEVFRSIVEETSPVADAIFTAHTHKSYAYEAPIPGEDGETRPIVQTGNYGARLASVTLEVDADGDWDPVVGGTQLLEVEEAPIETCDAEADPQYLEATRIAAEAEEAAEGPASEPVGTITDDLTTAWDPSKAEYQDGVWTATGSTGEGAKGDDRASESSLSNALADSMVWATQQEDYSGTEATIGVMNPGGVRADLWYEAAGGEGDGVVTFGEANGVVPFANNLSTVDLTGAQVKSLLEDQWQRDAEGNIPSRPFLALGLSENVDYLYDETLPERERILSVTIDGEPIDPDATYTVVAASFLTEGGDNFWTMAEGTNRTDTGILDRDAFTDYLGEYEDLEPNFGQRGTEFQELERGTQDGEESTPIVWRFSNLESRSLGAPQIESVEVHVEDQVYQAPYELDEETGEYAAVVELDQWQCLPAGEHEVYVDPVPDTGTVIPALTLQVESTGPVADECEDPTDPEPTTPTDPEPTDPEPTEPTQPADPDPSDDPTSSSPARGGSGTDDPRATSQADSPRGDLARTGAEVAPFVIGAGVLLLAGIVALVIRRRLHRD